MSPGSPVPRGRKDTEAVHEWFRSLLERSRYVVANEVTGRGTAKILTGGVYVHAEVEIKLGPGRDIGVDDRLPAEKGERLRREHWDRAVLYGVLDVLMTRTLFPITGFNLTIIDVDFQETEAYWMGVRIAAREAAENCLPKLELVPV